jgi:hypothetical protein
MRATGAGAGAGGPDDVNESDDDIWETDDEEEQDLGLGDESSKPREAGSRINSEANDGSGVSGAGGSTLGTLPPLSPSSLPKVCMSGSTLVPTVRSAQVRLARGRGPGAAFAHRSSLYSHHTSSQRSLGIWIDGGRRER